MKKENLAPTMIHWSIEEHIENNTEYLETSEGDEVECVSVENILGILELFNIDIKQKIK